MDSGSFLDDDDHASTLARNFVKGHKEEVISPMLLLSTVLVESCGRSACPHLSLVLYKRADLVVRELQI